MASRLGRILALGTLAAATLLVVVLAVKQRSLAAEFRQFRMRVALPQSGDVVPSFRAVTVMGDTLTVGEAPRGERQLLFILTKRCPYCRQTLPAWKALATAVDTARGPSVRVLAIALDSVVETALYVRGHGLGVPVIGFPSPKLARLYRAIAVPQTVVLDDQGTVRYAHTGLLTSAAVRDSVVTAALSPTGRELNDSTRVPVAVRRER